MKPHIFLTRLCSSLNSTDYLTVFQLIVLVLPCFSFQWKSLDKPAIVTCHAPNGRKKKVSNWLVNKVENLAAKELDIILVGGEKNMMNPMTYIQPLVLLPPSGFQGTLTCLTANSGFLMVTTSHGSTYNRIWLYTNSNGSFIIWMGFKSFSARLATVWAFRIVSHGHNQQLLCDNPAWLSITAPISASH